MNPLLDSRPPTIKDVARACGVSVATVSYVINGTRVLKPDTRVRILKAMEEMNYHPNAVARSLSSRRVYTIGVHCGVLKAAEFITNSYAAGILSGVLDRASQAEFDVTLFTARWQSVQKSAPMLRDGRTDGILLVAPPTSSDMLEGLAASGRPLVAISAPPQPGIPVVDVDNYSGAKMSARHIIELGHKRIAAILGDTDLAAFAPRHQGFCDALEEAGLPRKPDWIVPSRFDGSLAFEQTCTLLRGREPPTAICAGNDSIAIAVLDAARSLGVHVPQQLSVVGFDDSPFAAVVTPTLTTIRQPLHAIGACAATLLIERMEKQNPQDSQQVHLLAPELVVRDSTSVVPRS
jgi:DNA-binding LacI/PurR family transcriptional regulator